VVDTHQLGVAQDSRIEWRLERYGGQDHEHCEHCVLTWETIDPGDTAYVSGGGWISVPAYERLIRDDELRLRGSQEGRKPS